MTHLDNLTLAHQLAADHGLHLDLDALAADTSQAGTLNRPAHSSSGDLTPGAVAACDLLLAEASCRPDYCSPRSPPAGSP